MNTIVYCGESFQVDIGQTKALYLNGASSIVEDCECKDCQTYFHHFIKKPFSIFDFLVDCGVDIGKNLESEPTGVFSHFDENGACTFFIQVYHIHGTMSEPEYEFDLEEMGMDIQVVFTQLTINVIEVYLHGVSQK